MFRNVDDPDFVTVHHQFADETAAKALANQISNDEYKEYERQQGYIQVDTMEVTLLKKVE